MDPMEGYIFEESLETPLYRIFIAKPKAPTNDTVEEHWFPLYETDEYLEERYEEMYHEKITEFCCIEEKKHPKHPYKSEHKKERGKPRTREAKYAGMRAKHK
jgi:hypothetical protein